MEASVTLIGGSTTASSAQPEAVALSPLITSQEFRDYIRKSGRSPEVKSFLLTKLRSQAGIEYTREYLQVYLQECGYDDTVKDVLIAAKSVEGYYGYNGLFAAVLAYAARLENPAPVYLSLADEVVEDNPALVDLLSQCLFNGDPEALAALKFYHQHFLSQGKTNIVALLDYKCRRYLTAIPDYFSIVGAEDADGSGQVEASEPGYSPLVDVNQDQVIDLSEVVMHVLEGSSNPVALYQAITPLRDAVLLAFSESFDTAEGISPAMQQEADRYLAVLKLIAEGDFPIEIRGQAGWYIAEYFAAKAVCEGNYAEALAIYERFAEQYQKTPGGYYQVLAENRKHLDFLGRYYSLSDTRAKGRNGTHFLNRTLVNGHYFTRSSFEVGRMMKKNGIDAAFMQELMAYCPPEETTFSPEIPAGTLLEYSVSDTFEVNFPFCPQFIYCGTGEIVENAEFRYNMETHCWQVRIPVVDLLEQARGDGITLKFVFDDSLVPQGKSAPVIEIPIKVEGAADLPVASPASSGQFYEMLGQTLSEGQPIGIYYAVAPDKDAGIYFGSDTIDARRIASRFMQLPFFVIDTSTAEGKARVEKMKKELSLVRSSGRKAIEEYFLANLSERELLRLYRLDDRLIGGPLGIFDRYRQLMYTVTRVEYPESGDCLMRLYLAKRVPISKLSGEMKAVFDALPEEVKQKYIANGGLPIEMQVEFFNTTDSASLSVGRHLARKEEEIVTFQTHCYHVGPRERYQEEGIYPEIDKERPIAYFGNHCYGSQDLRYLSQLGEFYYPVATYDKTTANGRINLEVVDTLLKGGNPVSSARLAFTRAVPEGVSASAVYKLPASETSSAWSLYADTDRDGVPDPVDVGEQGEIVFNPIQETINVSGMPIKRGSPYFKYFLQQAGKPDDIDATASLD